MQNPDLPALFGMVDNLLRNVLVNGMQGEEISSYCQW